MTPSESQPSPSNSNSNSPVVSAAMEDLAQRHDAEPSEVSVVSQEQVTWRDGSLGCAEPDMAYTQALVDGTRIVLRLGDKEYEYHAGGTRPPFLCERPTQ